MLDVSKIIVMLIAYFQRLNAVGSFLVVADKTNLERVDTFKYLGVVCYLGIRAC